MKHKFVVLLSGVLVCSMLLAGCGTNKAAEAAKKSEEIEKEGKSSEGEEEKTKEEEVKVEEPEEEPEKIGILLPEDEGRWEADTALFTEKLEAAGYQAEVRSADGNLQTQREQIGELLEAEAVALVVDPVDAYGLSDAFTEAEEKKIPIFSYDDLVMNTDLVKYFTTFDTRADGNLVAENIIKRMDLKKAQEEKRSFTIEFLMGTPENMGELFFYNGVLEKLQEYLDDGTLVCRSGRLTFDDTSVMRGSAASAKAVMNRVISEFYEVEGTPDIICTAADAYTYALEETLTERNITPESGNWPFVTGREAKHRQ